jgi:MFS family permease
LTDRAQPVSALQSPWTTVIVLAIANTLSFIDRLLPSILLDPIRTSLNLSDTQMGIIHGLPFALFYATVGLWLGRLADRKDRVRLIAAGIFLWSIATIACAFAGGFWTLFAGRVAVAVGEAALAPAAYSLIAALFVASRLGRALSVYQIGIYLGSGLALILGGYIAGSTLDASAWRTAFIVAGLPGLVIAIMAYFLPEPRRNIEKPLKHQQELSHNIGGRLAYTVYFAAFSLVGIAAYGASTWLPSVLVRVHHIPLAQAGLTLGLILAIVSPLGVLTSGWLVDRAIRRGTMKAPFAIGAAGIALLGPAGAIYGFAPTAMTAIMAAIPLAFFMSYPFGVASVMLQLMTPAQARGRMAALYLLVFTIFGYGIGPVAIGWCNDRVFGGPTGVGLSMALVMMISAPLAAIILFMGRHILGDRLDAIHSELKIR